MWVGQTPTHSPVSAGDGQVVRILFGRSDLGVEWFRFCVKKVGQTESY